MSSPFFTPSPERTLLLIDELIDPDLSLRTIAERHKTTVAALSLWIALPETSAELDTFRLAFSDRIRLVAAANLNGAVGTLTRVLDRFNKSDHSALSPEERHRATQFALRACSVLVRLANFRSTPTPQAILSRPESPATQAFTPVRTAPHASAPLASMPPASMPSSPSTPPPEISPSALPLTSEPSTSPPPSSISPPLRTSPTTAPQNPAPANPSPLSFLPQAALDIFSPSELADLELLLAGAPSAHEHWP